MKDIYINCISNFWFFFFFLINLLGYFGLFIINKSNFILFTLTVFTRIVFFKLVFVLLNYIITKKINLDLLSLNIITVLLIVGIVYCNVFIFYPLISSTMYLRYVSFYTTVDNKYNSIYTSVDNLYNSIYTTINNLCTKIENSSINYKNDLTIYIESCEKYTSPFYNFSKVFSNGMAKMSHLYNFIYSFSTFITRIECKQSIANLLEVNKFAFSLLQSSLSNLTLKSFSRENFNYIISELRNGHNRDIMVIGQQKESSVESSSKDLLKAKDLTMSMAYNGESSSSGRITRSLKRKLDHLSTEGDKNSDLDETKEKRKKRIAREDSKKQAKKYPDYRAKKQVEVAEKNRKEYLDYLKDARIPEGTERASKMDWKTGVKGKMAVWLEDPDGNKFHYISQSDAAKDLGVKPSQVSGARLENHKIECKLKKDNIHTEFNKKYRVHKLNRFDKDVTKEIANKITNTKRKGNTIYICDINDNNIKEFTSLQQAADFLNTNSINLIKTYLGKGVGLKFKDKTYTVWRKNPVDFPEQLTKKIKIPIIKEHIAVSVTNSKGETTDYPNVAAACRSLGIEKYAKLIRRSHIDKESFKHGDESYSFKRK